ncbi:MAG TPA: hypothetical protein DEA46_06260 [Candidatus Moranbacteria bacterium]|nr:hypothetical protein [Candidatus Moranbacteria bacterium]
MMRYGRLYANRIIDESCFAGMKLSNFTIKKMTEVCTNDERYMPSVGLMDNKQIAETYASLLDGYGYTREIMVLTDGKRAFTLGDTMDILDRENVLVDIERIIREKVPNPVITVLSMMTGDDKK